jgi:hypothetical protein
MNFNALDANIEVYILVAMIKVSLRREICFGPKLD